MSEEQNAQEQNALAEILKQKTLLDVRELADQLWAYYDGLCRAGFMPAQALLLTVQLQNVAALSGQRNSE